MTNAFVALWRSDTTKALAAALNAPLLKHNPNRVLNFDRVINWGVSRPLFIRHNTRVLNSPDAVSLSSSKAYTLRHLKDKEVPTLEFSTEKNDAIAWLEDGKSVVCRDILNGHGGNGIRVIVSKDWRNGGRPDFAPARLYTRYFPKQREVRVHVCNGEVIAVAEKLKRLGEAGDYWIRSHSRGWLFAEARAPIGDAGEVAREAIKALGLDFGAVDIGISRDGACCVFETNTAPGLEGRTLEAYARALA